MYAQLDSIIFEPLTGFDKYSESEAAVLAIHNVITGKPKVQPMAMGLKTVSVSLRLHQEFVDVETAYQALSKLQSDHTSCSLLWGNGRLAGYFYIQSLSSDIEQQDQLGNIYSRIVFLELLEDANQNQLDRNKKDADKNAKAVGDKQPVNSMASNPPTCKQQVSKLLKSIDRYNNILQSVALSSPVTDDQNNELRANLTGMYNDLINLRRITMQLGDCTNRNAELDHEVTNTQQSLEIISAEVPVIDNVSFEGFKADLNNRITILINEGRSIIVDAESRQS